MYLDKPVKIPVSVKGISRKKIKGVTYIYYTYGRKYCKEKQYSVPQCTSIGKCVESNPEMMYPNANYQKFFSETEIEENTEPPERSSCLRIGGFLVIRKIITEYQLDEIAEKVIGKDWGLFLDFACYAILTENNAGQYYPEYAYHHPLFTQDMRVYSDTKISKFLSSITDDQSQTFLNEWNERMDHRERIYISYDSTNKHCQAGEIELAEFGYEKEKQGKPIFNYAVAYDRNNRVPLFYEAYPGSINDVSQLQYMLEKAKAYGYKWIGFILDRGYFSEANIHYMDQCGYAFIIMVKGAKSFVNQLILEKFGTFEQDRTNSIREYKVSGITVQRKLFPSDQKERYIHLFFSERKRTAEREEIESKIDDMVAFLKKQEGKKVKLGESFQKYFNLIYYHEGQEDEKFLRAFEKTDVINREIQLCGYYAIITSEKMTAQKALDLYKSRDSSEKLFRGDKSYLGNSAARVHSSESIRAKIFVEFVALIIRNRIYTYLKDEMYRNHKKLNYMTVPAALRELEKIELIKLPDGIYRLDYALTATQKAILNAFGLSPSNVRDQAQEICTELIQVARSSCSESDSV